MVEEQDDDAVALAAELTIAYLGNSNTRVSAEDIPTFLRSMHQTIRELSRGATAEPEPVDARQEGAVTARKSLASRDHIISMIDGKPYKTLRRHLAKHGLTPEQYRQRYGLKADYPMVAASYSEARRDMAQKIGLGSKGRAARKPGDDARGDAAPAADGDAPKRGRGRPRKARPEDEQQDG